MKKNIYLLGALLMILLSVFMSCDNPRNLTPKKVEAIFNNSVRPYSCFYIDLGVHKVPNLSPQNEHVILHLTSYNNGSKDASGKNIEILNGLCSGCLHCLSKYKEAGLITLDVLEDKGDTKVVNVQLTEKGAQYASRITPKDALIQVAKDKAMNACNIQIENNSNVAQAEVTWCYSELTPFPLAIGLKNDEPMVYRLSEPDQKRTSTVTLQYFEDKGWQKYR